MTEMLILQQECVFWILAFSHFTRFSWQKYSALIDEKSLISHYSGDHEHFIIVTELYSTDLCLFERRRLNR